MKTFYWLIKREHWEHRGGFLWSPIIASGVYLAINVLAMITGEVMARKMGLRLNSQFNENLLGQISKQGQHMGLAMDIGLYSAGIAATVTMIFVVFFYCLGALYDDRKDRSVLLWKSLPISDTETVLSKVAAAGVLAPLLAVGISIASGIATLLTFMAWAALHGISAWSLLAAAHPARILFNTIAAVPVYLVWALPSLGWLLLVSAWARGKAFLWAVGVPIGSGIVLTWFEMLAGQSVGASWFAGHVVGRFFLGLVPGGWLLALDTKSVVLGSTDQVLDLARAGHTWAQLAQPEMWVGALVGVAFVALAIRVRSRRSEV